ncbi:MULTISPECIES: hypothetical protein [unclassified Rickettsia]|nr:hypothetical protein [Rickettsia endosymbiont of Ceutorhynchus assimilis]
MKLIIFWIAALPLVAALLRGSKKVPYVIPAQAGIQKKYPK